MWPSKLSDCLMRMLAMPPGINPVLVESPFKCLSLVQEEIMTDTRYYVVGDHDAWMVEYEVSGLGPYGGREEAVIFAIDAAQKLCGPGKVSTFAWWTMMAASDQNGPTAVGGKQLERSFISASIGA